MIMNDSCKFQRVFLIKKFSISGASANSSFSSISQFYSTVKVAKKFKDLETNFKQTAKTLGIANTSLLSNIYELF